MKRATYPYKIYDSAVVEAFPNAFLAVLHPDKAFPLKPETARRWTDTLFSLGPVRQKIDQWLVDLLPGYNRGSICKDIQGHEDIASLVCALTALCVADGRCVAVGDQRLGYIVLPPLQFWGESGTGTSKWAEDAIRDNCTSVRRDFKDLTFYKDNKLWEPRPQVVSRRCTFGVIVKDISCASRQLDSLVAGDPTRTYFIQCEAVGLPPALGAREKGSPQDIAVIGDKPVQLRSPSEAPISLGTIQAALRIPLLEQQLQM